LEVELNKEEGTDTPEDGKSLDGLYTVFAAMADENTAFENPNCQNIYFLFFN
jgi:hypothetical protein